MIWLKVLEPNVPGIRAYTTAGFKPAGRLRRSGYWLGKPCDELIMDAVPEDYPDRLISAHEYKAFGPGGLLTDPSAVKGEQEGTRPPARSGQSDV
jgi:hypothetical protein